MDPSEQLAHAAGSMLEHLSRHDRVLFLTTSNRWIGETGGERPKSTRLALALAERLGPKRVVHLDIPLLKIYACEGNVSTARGNTCGGKDAVLNDPEKNPSGCHRCWASINNPDDELWRVSKALFESDAVVFFGSIRWGQMNAHYQKLIERLTWIENRHSTLGERNIVEHIEAGIVAIGHNWRGREVVETQTQVLSFFGFQTPPELSWNWSFTAPTDETNASYKSAAAAFDRGVARISAPA